MKEVVVSATKEYTVLIGEELLSQAGERVAAACGGEAAMLVTDDTVNALYGDAAERSLRAAGYRTSRFVFAHGERSKTAGTYIDLLRALAGARFSRSDAVVALGGGVAGDLAGFAAATWLRGVPFAQIPTTLLAMVDSSVGGKTAVDLPEGKNLMGAFYQPNIVLCDISALGTLPREVFEDGCAEMLKHGVILSAELFELLKGPIEGRMEDIVARNVAIKRDIVNADERESGIRQILNFGHTVGHAIEALSGYAVTHGRAVAIGMVTVSRAAARVGLCAEDCHAEIADAVGRYGLPRETDFPPERLAEAAMYDKKRDGQRVTLIVPERIGSCGVKQFDMGELEAFIRLGVEV